MKNSNVSAEKLKTLIQGIGPKKILALDGGGIRGMITVEILGEIEKLLRKKLGKDDKFRLSDYFDFVAGTSTGAIIAACISVGMKVSEIKSFYVESGREMFDKASLLKRMRYRYEDENLANKLRQVFKHPQTKEELLLGSDQLKTVLMMVMRNATTDSPWPISNNPHAMYNQTVRKDGSLRDNCNLYIPLWQLVRASTAAPVYFPPEVVKLGNQEFVFVDGGITTYNNPAFQAFLMATIKPYEMNWTTGEDKMLIVSIGTGTSPGANADLDPDQMNVLYNAKSLPSALMAAALNEQDFLCRVFGKCLVGDSLDREVGDMIGVSAPRGSNKLFTYLRFNANLTSEGLRELGLPDIKPENVQRLDSIEHIGALQSIGQAVAKKVKPEQFEGFV
ncbi:Patatin-like phospholipase [Nitrosospira sp. Nl5]|uniref:patatin-like phospholipase family protein n=1 Tax=Nitrosospira sp. Nl5 TaxID=200120 RepID=UPI00088DC6FC|nr:patatin-like phospholipase family protein [Nitrosospira sp. Nl5]SCY62018.1 Patatin-like phospholipase [Nitrosospira sp. Nl5]